MEFGISMVDWALVLVLGIKMVSRDWNWGLIVGILVIRIEN